MHGFSYVVWLGDLNFRLTEGSFDGAEIANRSSKGDLSSLLAADQLTSVRKEKRSLHELQEMEIVFPPTYKLKVGAARTGGGTDFNLK